MEHLLADIANDKQSPLRTKAATSLWMYMAHGFKNKFWMCFETQFDNSKCN